MSQGEPSTNKDSGSRPQKEEKRAMVELKNGKVIFRQKPMAFDKSSETMQEIVQFREMLKEHVDNQRLPLTAMPDAHKPLIAKLAHESDKTIAPLVKQIRSELLPAEEGANGQSSAALPPSTVENAVKEILVRSNYGIDGPLGQKLPATICVWRWEVRDEYKDWLPKSALEKAEARHAERVQAKQELASVFDALSQADRDTIMDPKGTSKLSQTVNNPGPSASSNSSDHKTKPDQATQIDGIENEVDAQAKKVDPVKVAKAKEREEQRALKVEKEKKLQAAQEKSRSLMANFFGKTRVSAKQDSPKTSRVSAPSAEAEYYKTFKPFILKKGAELAPVNYFMEQKKRRNTRSGSGQSHAEAIMVDEDPFIQKIGMDNPVGGTSISTYSERERLEHTLRLLDSRRGICTSGNLGSRHGSVRDAMARIAEAEVADDPAQVRTILSLLRDRDYFPAKVLIFQEDNRPGYFGTWTRPTQVVGPRRPFAKDVVARDYGYDSGEEWEAEEPGDADDVMEDGEDDEGDGEEPDSDLDSWLVDDEDVEDPGTPIEARDNSPPLDFPLPLPKRKEHGDHDQPTKKRRMVVPLVPFAKGPCWEPAIGECEYEPFEHYRIQLLNDCPCPIDPFTYISTALEERPPVNSDGNTFVVPTVPNKVGGVVSQANGGANSTSKRVASALTPKTTFPDTYLPILLSKISSLATSNLTFIVESIYQELKENKVKKNAIEAKVREVGEKCKDRRIWIVKGNGQDVVMTA
ncbi:hypothetical protein CONPUDRAFT_149822 [Coniophora puteana RWD-64-598 SS2]|uniref:Chromatin assembly factor 1 subunit A dimerization domain-containing protein n=1 Tax=Coniophora puteana (strain RWD-64-598) TaxID=741705 RepID=A0A5M3N0N9_CONPW|nr:uncharacterized protein CONPUDRAFT_149822 [Coniophora puteana RWD-64-598 SS2]EIW84959.1 hypothetical protein CONPUDRAFT_149822 [Coniophora puteana RWD-64-598 SS2]